MKKSTFWILSVTGLGTLVAVLFLVKMAEFKAMAQTADAPIPPEVVTSSPVMRAELQPTIQAVGSLASYQGVTVTTEAAGIVSKICFKAGAKVHAGDLLVQMDISVLQAQLESAEARAELARVSARRARDLYAKNTIAKADLDTAEAQLKQAYADVASAKALIAQKEIRAPFSGRLGVRQINVGQYIDRGNPIVSLESLNPIYVNFTVPQQQLADMQTGLVVKLSVDAFPSQVFEGKITAINPEVDSVMRTAQVQATLTNADELLHPGMYATVSVVLPKKVEALLIPTTAVLYAPYGDSVFVIDEKKDPKTGVVGHVLEQRFVRLGRAEGDFVAVEKGLKEGDHVASTGVFKLRNGEAAVIDNTLLPKFSLTPKPSNS